MVAGGWGAVNCAKWVEGPTHPPLPWVPAFAGTTSGGRGRGGATWLVVGVPRPWIPASAGKEVAGMGGAGNVGVPACAGTTARLVGATGVEVGEDGGRCRAPVALRFPSGQTAPRFHPYWNRECAGMSSGWWGGRPPRPAPLDSCLRRNDDGRGSRNDGSGGRGWGDGPSRPPLPWVPAFAGTTRGGGGRQGATSMVVGVPRPWIPASAGMEVAGMGGARSVGVPAFAGTTGGGRG